MTPQKITTMAQLKRAAKNGADFFILLNGGLRSSKYITWDAKNKVFLVFNGIDGTDVELTEAQIMDRNYTNIGHAMTVGAPYLD